MGSKPLSRFSVGRTCPSSYLTAYADNHTLERAKVTSPPGHISNPIKPNEFAYDD